MCTSIIMLIELNQTIIKLLKNRPKCGARRSRTADLLRARQSLYQLSYGPSIKELVGLGGFEPPTSSLSEMRSNQLSYRPSILVTIQFV